MPSVVPYRLRLVTFGTAIGVGLTSNGIIAAWLAATWFLPGMTRAFLELKALYSFTVARIPDEYSNCPSGSSRPSSSKLPTVTIDRIAIVELIGFDTVLS